MRPRPRLRRSGAPAKDVCTLASPQQRSPCACRKRRAGQAVCTFVVKAYTGCLGTSHEHDHFDYASGVRNSGVSLPGPGNLRLTQIVLTSRYRLAPFEIQTPRAEGRGCDRRHGHRQDPPAAKPTPSESPPKGATSECLSLVLRNSIKTSNFHQN